MDSQKNSFQEISFQESLIERAKADKRHIVLPEGNDERILLAADEILQKDFAELTIFGNPGEMRERAERLGLRAFQKARLLDYKQSPLFADYARKFYEQRKSKGISEKEAFTQMEDRNYFGVMMVRNKDAHGMVSGADGTTADTIRPALSIIKTRPGSSIASSVFLLCLSDGRVWVFGDCAVNPNPSPAQLAEIAILSAQTASAFGIEPRVAMLSYSSGASGAGPDVDMVREAVKIALEARERLGAGFPLDGPIQFDAAVDPKTAASKMPNSPVAGRATVMIFPDLNAGNICYKAVQRAANALAIGPVIQGLNAPVNDLSRGASVEDIVNTVAITAIQAQAG
jgi:phosphate acetyltransferase